jgi:hypothetical protein
MATVEVMKIDPASMVVKIQKARSDALMIDFSRIICAHFGKMVEYYSKLEGNEVSAHNNKALFTEAIDLWCRATLNQGSRRDRQGVEGSSDPRMIAAHVMTPWYEAMALDDPSAYRMGRRGPPPPYTGSVADATAFQLGLAACLEIQPLRIVAGMEDGQIRHVWGKLKADNTWYDSDVSTPRLRLGERGEYPEYDEIEVPL